jgi:hypothetical protein
LLQASGAIPSGPMALYTRPTVGVVSVISSRLLLVPWTKPGVPGVASPQVRLPPVGGLLRGRYTLAQDDLGEGGFGAVYAGQDNTAPGNNVAVKVCMRGCDFWGFKWW